MHGTVSRYRGYTFRLESGGDEYITAAAWRDRETYAMSAADERQQRWFARLREHLDGDPQWNDGEVIFASGAAVAGSPAR